MDLSREILSQIVVYTKYARYVPELKRREVWKEIVDRNKEMHIKRFPELESQIENAYKFVHARKVLPSMRSLQFAGKPIEISPNRQYNCAYAPVDDWHIFSEIMFLLLGGSGVGYSVQFHHVDQLPEVRKPSKRNRRHLIADSIEGWADAIKVLMKAYFFGLSNPIFDFSDVRPKGCILKTSGGRAPGPQPLKDCIHRVVSILDAKETNTKLTPLETHDIICFISESVLSGGIRRAACAAMFSMDDEEMLTCKYGNWWNKNPQRRCANNSAVIMRHRIKRKEFFDLWKKIKLSGCGEPSFVWSNHAEQGWNPCQPAYATVLTPSGISTIGEVDIGDLIWNGKQFTKITKKWSTGIKPVFEFSTTAGIFIGTENHRVISNGEKIEAGVAMSVDTSQGPCGEFIPDKEEDLTPVMDGLVIGDGTVHWASNGLVCLCVGDKDKDYFSDPISAYIIKHRPGINKVIYEIKTSIEPEELPKTFQRTVPDRYFKAGISKKLLFLRGLYSANGSVVSKRVCLKSTSFDIINRVQMMLSSVGIKSYYTTNKSCDVKFHNGTYKCKESFDLSITTDRKKFRDLIGFIQVYKQEKLNNICSTLPNKGKSNYDMVSRNLVGSEEVFDLTVEAEEHTYWTGGLLVSNCFEASLSPQTFCNLTEINASNIQSQKDLNDRTRVASFIATLQSDYTDFHYLRDDWRKNTERDALIGVSMTGIATGEVLKYDVAEAAEIAVQTNIETAKLIGINPARRVCCLKPAGSSSLVLGCPSGIGADWAQYYIRRMKLNKEEPIYKYLSSKLPELIEDSFEKPHQDAVLTIPIKVSSGAITRDNEDVMDLLERIKKFNVEWIQPGHIKGDNSHNVSATVHIKKDEWDAVGKWMWDNREFYAGLSVFPFSDVEIPQLPFEPCSRYIYEKLFEYLKKIDLTKIVEEEDNTDLTGEAACAGGACEIT